MTPAESLADQAWRACGNTGAGALCLACVLKLAERIVAAEGR